MKKAIFSGGLFIILVILMFLGFRFKSNLTNYASKVIKNQTSKSISSVEYELVDSLYNYKKYGGKYSITFLEFGAVGCVACNKMEIVMRDIRKKFSQKVNVKFINLLVSENQQLMSFFGIATIPTQILLNKKGIEIYRHTGYISTNELQQVISNNLN